MKKLIKTIENKAYLAICNAKSAACRALCPPFRLLAKPLGALNSPLDCLFRKTKTALKNNKGMEVVQVLIIVIIALTLGALLLATLKTEFAEQLKTVGTKLSGMFS